MIFDSKIKSMLICFTRGKQPSKELAGSLEMKVNQLVYKKVKYNEKVVTIQLNPICEAFYEYTPQFLDFLETEYPEYII